jgi:hypothetical protein
MSQIIVEDEGWKALMADPRLAAARRKLSFHEIRLIVQHARASVSSEEAWPLGKAGDAVDFACDHISDRLKAIGFLEGWREGDVGEWPEYSKWLAVQHKGAKSAAMRKAAQRGDYCGIVEVDETDFRADEPVAKDGDTR